MIKVTEKTFSLEEKVKILENAVNGINKNLNSEYKYITKDLDPSKFVFYVLNNTSEIKIGRSNYTVNMRITPSNFNEDIYVLYNQYTRKFKNINELLDCIIINKAKWVMLQIFSKDILITISKNYLNNIF